mmetsp:Transcript_15107/g.40895  ORF Transcript_15107/g.40895 Transcript_15107/m.40895 type:complete len:101 (-) Transcript_15107:3529-3831(-)
MVQQTYTIFGEAFIFLACDKANHQSAMKCGPLKLLWPRGSAAATRASGIWESMAPGDHVNANPHETHKEPIFFLLPNDMIGIHKIHRDGLRADARLPHQD